MAVYAHARESITSRTGEYGTRTGEYGTRMHGRARHAHARESITSRTGEHHLSLSPQPRF